MTKLEQSILDIVRASPGIKAKDIASKLGIDKGSVNSALYGPLRALCFQNESYQWFSNKEDAKPAADELPKPCDQRLANLRQWRITDDRSASA